jgi:hypothetical protein
MTVARRNTRSRKSWDINRKTVSLRISNAIPEEFRPLREAVCEQPNRLNLQQFSFLH